jgi:hypothetical protein
MRLELAVSVALAVVLAVVLALAAISVGLARAALAAERADR